MFQIDETAGTYLYYVHDIIMTDNYTPVDKATSELFPLGSDDIAPHLEISDQIRSKPIQPKDAMRAASKRQLNHKNPNKHLLNLSVSSFCGLIRAKNDAEAFLSRNRVARVRLDHKNPNVQLLALSVSTLCWSHTRVKNDGDHFLVEIASREFMDYLVSVLKNHVLNPGVKKRYFT